MKKITLLTMTVISLLSISTVYAADPSHTISCSGGITDLSKRLVGPEDFTPIKQDILIPVEKDDSFGTQVSIKGIDDLDLRLHFRKSGILDSNQLQNVSYGITFNTLQGRFTSYENKKQKSTDIKGTKFSSINVLIGNKLLEMNCVVSELF